MILNGDRLIFSTGLTLSPNGGFIGISPALALAEGFDYRVESLIGRDLTPAECAELADYMVALWLKFWRTHGFADG